jgi:hypothetical protein
MVRFLFETQAWREAKSEEIGLIVSFAPLISNFSRRGMMPDDPRSQYHAFDGGIAFDYNSAASKRRDGVLHLFYNKRCQYVK